MTSGVAKSLAFTPIPTAATTSVAFNVTVTAQDQYGNTVTSNTGSGDTVSLSGTGPSSATYGPVSHALSAGVYTFSVTLGTTGTWSLSAADTTNSGGVTGVTANNINVSTVLTIQNASLLGEQDANQTTNSDFPLTLTAVGGAGGPYTFTVASGSTLPTGISLTNNSGTYSLTGSPSVSNVTGGIGYSFTLQVADSSSATTTKTFTLLVYPALSLPALTLPTGYTGNVVYNNGTAATITGTGGSPSTVISVPVRGGLPADGLSATRTARC